MRPLLFRFYRLGCSLCLFGAASLSAALSGSASANAEPPRQPNLTMTRTFRAPVIQTTSIAYGTYVTDADPQLFQVNPNLPKKECPLPNTRLSRQEILDTALSGTGFTLDVAPDVQAILAQSKPVQFISSDRLIPAAGMINAVLRTPTALDPLDYAVEGKTIKVFRAAKDTEGFTLRRVNINVTDASLDAVLRDLLQRTGYDLFLPIRLNTRVSVHCENVTVAEALHQVLAASSHPLRFEKITGGGVRTLFIQGADSAV